MAFLRAWEHPPPSPLLLTAIVCGMCDTRDHVEFVTVKISAKSGRSWELEGITPNPSFSSTIHKSSKWLSAQPCSLYMSQNAPLMSVKDSHPLIHGSHLLHPQCHLSWYKNVHWFYIIFPPPTTLTILCKTQSHSPTYMADVLQYLLYALHSGLSKLPSYANTSVTFGICTCFSVFSQATKTHHSTVLWPEQIQYINILNDIFT